MDRILRLLRIPIEWIFRYFFGINQNEAIETDLFRVQIKTSNNRTIPLVLQPSWTIKDVKSQLASILDIADPESLGIILAGRELDNDVQIHQMDIGRNTVLHAVKIVQKVKPKPPLNEELVDLQITGEDRKRDGTLKAHFFIYCKECQPECLQPGKLRVRCFTCRETSIIIYRDPCGWSDVLGAPGTINGHCLNSQCDNVDNPAPAEFFFKCHSSEHLSELNEVPPLYQIRTNIHNIPCLACGDELDTVMVFESCQHVICLSCFEIYIKSRLNDRQFITDEEKGYTLGCPVGCQSSLISEPKHFLAFLSKDDYDRYQRFASEECVLKNGGILCPQPHCGAGILPEDLDERKIKCNECNFVFCKRCSNGYHLGECEEEEPFSILESRSGLGNLDSDTVSRAKWQDQKSSLLTIKVMTKPCPKCRTATERAGGCMHMECTRCSFQWCWLCQTTWTRECMASHWFH